MWKLNYIIDEKFKPKILLCDPENHTKNTLTRYLTSIGFFVDEVNTSYDCVKSACVTHPDVILLDMDIMEKNLWNTISMIRRLCYDVPILLFTEKDYEIPCDDFSAIVKKPYLPKEIGILLETLLLETKKEKVFMPRRYKVQ